MRVLIFALALLLCAVMAPAAAAAAPAPAAAPAVDQAGWAARKLQVTLPNGVKLAYVELGDPKGAPVLFLHGFTDSSRAWTILAPQLLEHRLLILDQRGHGASDTPACCYGVDDLAEDARLLLDELGVGRVSVVGHSLGSMVAQRLAAEHPDRVDRIALLGSTALAPLRRGDWLWQQVQALKTPIAANREFLREWSFGASPTPVDATFVRFADADAAAVPLHVWRNVAAALLDHPVGSRAGEVRAKVLILSGGADPLFPAEHHRSLIAAYPAAEAHVFPDLGHNFIAERPDAVGPVLAAFLRR